MTSPRQISSVFRDLQQIGRSFPRTESGLAAQGDVILDAFLRLAPSEWGAVYLKEHREGGLRLAARSDGPGSTDTVPFEVPDDVVVMNQHPGTVELSPHMLIPLRYSRESFGMVALGCPAEADSDDETVHMMRTVASYLSAILESQRMASEIREGEFQQKYRLWELEALYDIGLSIASTLDLDKVADEILVRTISLLNARRAALYLRSGERYSLHRSFGEVRASFLDEELGQDALSNLLSDGGSLTFEQGADCVFPDCESFVALPIRSGSEVIGVLAAADRELREGGVGPFEANDLRMLSLFANQAAIALENARLHHEALQKQAMERELELAATIQREILPRGLPALPGFDIDAFSRPAKQLGGDYHAFFVNEGLLTFCVADVAGKSVPAAVLVSALHAALQLLVDEGRSLGEIATELNRHIHRWSSENKFITMVIATVDRDAESVYFVNAGHNPAYVVTSEGLETLASHGLPIGILPGTVYRTQSRRFSPGSVLVVYSDGIVEAESVDDDQFGNTRLEMILSDHRTAPAAAVRKAIVKSVDAFTAGAVQSDDQTMVIVRI